MTSKRRDPYQTVIDRFNQSGIHYVVIGMAGINYYAWNASEIFGTMDYDIFLRPTLANVQKAIQLLENLGFSLGTARGQLQPSDIKRIVRSLETLVATNTDGIMLELLLKVSGYPFPELEKDAAIFSVGGIPVKVGRLKKLLQSKRAADRPKDRVFLKRYRMLLKEILDKEDKKRD